MPTSAFQTFNSPSTTRLDPWYNPEDAEQQVVKLADGTYARGTILGEKVGISDAQTITLANVTGGTFTITVPTTPLHAGATTTTIASNGSSTPTLAAVEEALETLACIGEGNVVVTGTPGSVYTVTFQNELADIDIELTTDATQLTSNSTATAAVTTGTEGDPGTLGTFAAYDPEATDGTQHARCILRYACSVSSGVLTGLSDWGATVNAAPAFMRGYFRTEQLVGLDSGAVTDLGATIVQGTMLSGVIRVG